MAAPAQRGVALLTVLLVVFLATVAATGLASVQQVAIRRSSLLLHQEQARLYTLGAEQWAAAILARDRAEGQIDHLGEEWAALPPALPVQGGSLSGRIEDLQGRFNLNNLVKQRTTQGTVDQGTVDQGTVDQETVDQETVDQDQLRILKRLLELLELDPGIADAIVDWIDADQDVRFPDGAEDGDYAGHTPPYRTADRPLFSASELRLVKGIDQEVYAKLAPYVCALPEATPVNVNTASAPVLAAVVDTLELARAEALVEDRPAEGYPSIKAFLSIAQPGGSAPAEGSLTVSSGYFRVEAEANVGDGRAVLHSLLQRTGNGGTRVLLRNYGNDAE